MTKAEAIAEIKRVQNGGGVDRHSRLNDIPRGAIAVDHWDDGLFTLGIEYGYIISLMKLFDIGKEDLQLRTSPVRVLDKSSPVEWDFQSKACGYKPE